MTDKNKAVDHMLSLELANAELTRLRKKNDFIFEILEFIANPTVKIKEFVKIHGVDEASAIQLSKEADFLKDIAKAALSQLK